jgi:hypothetical protein
MTQIQSLLEPLTERAAAAAAPGASRQAYRRSSAGRWYPLPSEALSPPRRELGVIAFLLRCHARLIG